MQNFTSTQTELISVQQASAKYPVHQNTIRNWYSSGKLEFQRAKKQMVVFRESDLVKILTERGYFLGVQNG